MPEELQNQDPATDTPTELTVPMFGDSSDDLKNTDSVDAGDTARPGVENEESTPTGGEATEPENTTLGDDQGTTVEPSSDAGGAAQEPIEERYKGAQQKLHEQAQELARLKQLVESRDNEMKQQYQEALKLMIENQKRQAEQTATKEPTEEEVRQKWIELANEDPYKAVQLEVQRQLQSLKYATPEQVEGVVEKVAQQTTQQKAIEMANANINNLMTSKNIADPAKRSEELNAFENFIRERLPTGMDKSMADQALMAIVTNPQLLNQRYDEFNLITRKDQIKSEITKNHEAKVAEKLKQSSGPTLSNGPNATPKLSDIFSESVEPDVARVLTL